MCMEGMGEGSKIMGQNIINCKTVSIFISGGRLRAHPPSPRSAGSYGYQRECESEQAKVIYAHMALVLP